MTPATARRRTPLTGTGAAAGCWPRLDGLGPATLERLDEPVTVEFRLLGEVGVRLDGCEVDTGHSRQRSIPARAALPALAGVTREATQEPRIQLDRLAGAVFD